MSIKVCKGCQDRTVEPNCHMECERYLKAVEEQRALQDKIDAERKLNSYYSLQKRRWR